MSDTPGGALGEAAAGILLAAVNAARKSRARRAERDLVREARRLRAREEELRREWLRELERQKVAGDAGDGTMRDVRHAQRSALDERMFGSPGPVRVPPHGNPSPLVFGVELNRATGETAAAACYDGPLPVVLCGGMGAGKSTRILTPFFMTARNLSYVAFCAKGTAPFQCAAAMARFAYTGVINPGGVLEMRSDGFNPIARYHPSDKRFRRNCIRLSEALHDRETGTGEHFRTSAVALFALLIADEVDRARKEGRVPYLPNARTRLCEPDKWENYTDAAGKTGRRLVGGLSLTLRRIALSGHPAVRDLAGKFTREHGQNELSGVVNTAEVQTRVLHDPQVMEDMKGRGVDLTHLCDQQSRIFVCISPEDLAEFNKIVRLVITVALQSHFRPGKYKTVFLLDEFRATVSTLDILRQLWSTMREYKAQFFALVTSLTQLSAVWGEEWQNMLGQCGATVLLGPAPDLPSAEFFSKRSGNTTVAQLGYSENIGTSDGNNAGEGFGQSVGSFNSNRNAGRNAGGSQGGGRNVTQTQRPFLTPQQLMSLRPGEGRMWFPSMGEKSVPFFAPNYWMRRGDWTRAVRKNPYYGK